MNLSLGVYTGPPVPLQLLVNRDAVIFRLVLIGSAAVIVLFLFLQNRPRKKEPGKRELDRKLKRAKSRPQ
jgi:hypothetical protein